MKATYYVITPMRVAAFSEERTYRVYAYTEQGGAHLGNAEFAHYAEAAAWRFPPKPEPEYDGEPPNILA